MNKKNRKGFTLVEIMIVVVIIGLLAAMAIPAFNKVRQTSREKAVINNLRQIASAGQQYLLDTGKTQVLFEDLEGTYFPTIQKVAGETYGNTVTVKQEGGTIYVKSDGLGKEAIVFTY